MWKTIAGIDQVERLRARLAEVGGPDPSESVSGIWVLLALGLSVVPFYLHEFRAGISPSYEITLMGSACMIGLIMRWSKGLRGFVFDRRSFPFVHTAVALGCIPAVGVVLVLWMGGPSIALVAHKAASLKTGGASAPNTFANAALFAAMVAVWAGVTEEILFRGVLVSMIRRWGMARNLGRPDFIAVVLSAAIFSLCHLGTWGPLFTFAIFGLGLGFGVGYIAAREQLVPVICYHVLFDFLSVMAQFWIVWRRH